MVPFNLDTQTLGSPEATLHTEATWTMRVLDGALHVPYLDPQSIDDASQGQLAATIGGGQWGIVTSCDSPVPVHAFDVAKTIDGLWLFGAADNPDFPPADPDSGEGSIWRSTDDGATWAQSLAVTGGSNARFFAAAQFGDNLIAYFVDNGTFTAYRWDSGGTEWTEIDPATTGATASIVETTAAFTYLGDPFVIGFTSGKNSGIAGGSGIAVLTFPDTADPATILASLPDPISGNHVSIIDATATTDYLWMLTTDFHVYRGDDAGEWTNLMTVDDDTVVSLAVDPAGGYLYFGTTDSRILRTPIPT